jgi:hypothetical protein
VQSQFSCCYYIIEVPRGPGSLLAMIPRHLLYYYSDFDPKVMQQLIEETGQFPEGVARR